MAAQKKERKATDKQVATLREKFTGMQGRKEDVVFWASGFRTTVLSQLTSKEAKALIEKLNQTTEDDEKAESIRERANNRTTGKRKRGDIC